MAIGPALPPNYVEPLYKDIQFGIKTDDTVGLTTDQRLAEELQLTFSVTNEATWLYKNYKYPRYKNFYGYAQLMSGVYVVRSIELSHINQELLHWQDSRAYIVQELHCGIRKILEEIYLYSEKEPKTNPLPPERFVPLKQRYTSIRFRLCPGVEANVAIRWAETVGRCSNVFAPPKKQAEPQPGNNQDGSPSNRPPAQGEDPEDPSNNDDRDIPDDEKPVEPKPGTKKVIVGQWYGVYTGFNPGCNGEYPARRFALGLPTSSSNVPSIGGRRSGSCGGSSFDAEITLNGVVVDTPRDCTSYTFDFVP